MGSTCSKQEAAVRDFAINLGLGLKCAVERWRACLPTADWLDTAVTKPY